MVVSTHLAPAQTSHDSLLALNRGLTLCLLICCPLSKLCSNTLLLKPGGMKAARVASQPATEAQGATCSGVRAGQHTLQHKHMVRLVTLTV